MSMESAIFQRLVTDTTLKGLVDGRIYPVVAPQGTDPPYVTYQRVSGAPEHHHGGNAGVSRARLQVDVWAATYADAKATGDAARNRIDSFQGTIEDVDGNSTNIRSCLTVNEQDLTQTPVDASDKVTHRVSMDFALIYS